jgi:hypothetical protein
LWRAARWMADVRFPVGARNCSLLHSFQTGSGAHLASYITGTGELFHAGVKRSGREAENSPPPSAEVKNDGAMPPLPLTASWRGA